MSSNAEEVPVKVEAEEVTVKLEGEEVSVKSETESPALSSSSILSLSNSQPLPQTVAEFKKFRFHKLQAERDPAYLFSMLTAKLVRSQKQLEYEVPGAQQAVYNVLSAINRLQQAGKVSDADEKMLQIRYILNTIMGNSPRARGRFSFPAALETDASAVLEAVNKRLPPVEEALVEGPGPEGSSSSTPRAPKRRRTNNNHQRPLPVSEQTLAAALRGLIVLDGGRRTYRIADKSIVRDCNIAGHNGIAIGTWWPYRICALRDGAHGATMAGIAGNVDDGAYSIVVSSMYADLDQDNGDILYYSGSKAHDNVDPQNPIMSTSTRALQTSKREDRSVRVLRAAGGDSRYAPSVGLRYDGLYKIIDELLPMNHKGGRYVRFTLVRNFAQDKIDLSRPNAQERALYASLKEL